MLKTLVTLVLLMGAIVLATTSNADASTSSSSNGTHCEQLGDSNAYLCSVSDEESESGTTEWFILFCEFAYVAEGDTICIPTDVIHLSPINR